MPREEIFVWPKTSTQSMAVTPQARHDAHELQAFRCRPGLYTAQHKGSNVYVLIYVDGILIAAKEIATVIIINERL